MAHTIIIKCNDCGATYRPLKIVQVPEEGVMLVLSFRQFKGLFHNLGTRHFVVPPDDAIPCVIMRHALTWEEVDVLFDDSEEERHA